MFVNRIGVSFFVAATLSFVPASSVVPKKHPHECRKAWSIDADLGCDAISHGFEAACIPKKGRALTRHSLPILCGGRSEALPFAVFSRLTSLAEIGGATHASRGAHTPSRRTFAARAATTRCVAEFGGGSWHIRESVTQMRAWTCGRRGKRRCCGAFMAAVGTRRRAWRSLDDSVNRSGLTMDTPEHGKQDRK
jgi:hypothetical protein